MKVGLSTLSAFLIDLFSEYDRQSVEYCLLRNFEHLPERLNSRDIDILVSRDCRNAVLRIVFKLAKQHDLIIYKHFFDERFDQISLFKRFDINHCFHLQVDLFYDSELYGVRLISGSEIIKSRLRYRNFFIANDVYMALDKWLFNYLLCTNLPEKYHIPFSIIFKKNRKSIAKLLSEIFGITLAQHLVSQICSTGFANLPPIPKHRLFLILSRLACKDPRHHVRHIPLFLWYRLKHTLTPKGEFLSLSGPDGSGKTTILKLSMKQLERLFVSRSENHGHFRPNALPRIASVALKTGIVSTIDTNYESPHRKNPSGLFGSLLRFFYYLFDYSWGYFTKIRPAMVRRELVIYDRYYFDMVADPGRSRIALPLWIRKLGLRLIPLPHIAFFVQSPAEKIRERKQELTLQKIEELNAGYIDLVNSSKLLILENDQPTDVAAARFVDMVIECRRKRFKLDRLHP